MEQRNLILAIVISVAILLAFQFFIELPRMEKQARQAEQQAAEQITPEAPSGAQPSIPSPSDAQPGEPGARAKPDRTMALEQAPRVAIESDLLKGSISLRGGAVDDLVLTAYHQTVQETSPYIVLLHPTGATNAYFANFGWTATDKRVSVPNSDTLWEANRDTLTPNEPVTLSWENGQGLRFERVYAVDDHYMFTITQRVVNTGKEPVTLSAYGLISRSGTPPTLGYFILHEGLLGVFDGTLKEIDYDEIQEDGAIQQSTTGGWLGITDKYWLTALIPNQTDPVDTRFVHTLRNGTDKYQADFLYDSVTVDPGAEAQAANRLFAGAKVVSLLDRYQEQLGIPRFDRAVDFGWFYFLTKPLFYMLHYTAEVFGNFGVAILLLTVLIKIVFFPLANKSYRAMAKMRNLQPEMLRLRERFGDDKQRLNQEMMTLYKREGANPVSGCLPIVIQIPVFFALYKVLFVTIEMRHAPFYGWIQDLSAPDPTSILNGFGLLPWTVPDLGILSLLSIGIWPIIMGVTMFLQMKLNPQPADPVQAKIFLLMPIVFTFLLAPFPAGLVIYWTWNNILSILQQYVIMKRAGHPVGSAKAT